MKAIVGIDLGGAFRPALDILARLQFPEARLHFLNVVEPILPDGAFPELAATHPMAQILEDLLRAGREAISELEAQYSGTATGEVALGLKVSTLLGVAESQQADLIAVGSQPKSALEALFAGHVTRALTTDCPWPVLIGKHAVRCEGSMTVVVAHDLSEYGNRAIDRLVSWRPQGIGRIVLVTANTTDPSLIAVAERIEPKMAGETVDVIRARLAARHEQVVAHLSPLGVPVESVLSEGDPRDVIRDVMQGTKADLLVMGAQGHGFVERLFVGSVALHEVVREPYNVLLVRA